VVAGGGGAWVADGAALRVALELGFGLGLGLTTALAKVVVGVGEVPIAAGDPDGLAPDDSRFAHTAPRTTAAMASEPSRTHHRLDIRPSVRATARRDPRASGRR
jgi:hypothetical protein